MITRVSTHIAHGSIEVDLPVKIESALNLREHHMKRAKRVKEQRTAVFYSLANFRKILALIVASQKRIIVTFTRLAPRSLDSHDNLRAGFKACADQVADMLGLDDRDPRIDWRYKQERSRTYSARVAIEAGGEG